MGEEEKIIETEKGKVIDFLTKKNSILVVLGILVLLFIAWNIRTANISGLRDVTTNDYTLGPDLDPFLFLRYAKIIVNQGSLPAVDTMRYVPLGFNTGGETQMLPYMIAYFHKIITPFSGKSINYSAVIFPVYMFLLTVIAFFFFIRKVFEENKNRNWIAIVATLFLIISPSLLPRTIAGIPEKESAGFFFMFLVFYFFIASWKAEKLRSTIILGILAGVSTSLMGMIWGGWIYIFTVLALYGGTVFMLGKIDRLRFCSYSAWFLSTLITTFIFSTRFSFRGFLFSTSSGLSFIIFGLILTDFIIFNTRVKEAVFIQNLKKKVPDRIVSLIIAAVLGLIFATIFLGISYFPNFIKDITEQLTQPYNDRLSFTVAENRQPYFNEWRDSFGPIVQGVPLLFWLFFIGSIFLFYKAVKDIEKKGRIILTGSYILFLFALVFSRYSSSSVMNGVSSISNFIYFGSFIFIFLSSAYLFWKYHKENNLDELKKINASYLLLIAFFFVSLVGARSAIRLIMVLAPPAAGIVGFFIFDAIEMAKNKNEETMKYIAFFVAGIVIVASVYTAYYHYEGVLAGAKQMIPSMYTQQWQKAMAWVRENTPENSVFAHWWDYGYWVQSIGNRATVTDGGNAIGYWNYLVGRHLLTGQTEKESLDFLYTHNASYLLIDSTDIGKYGAYSSIGSDENYDRYSWIGTFLLDEKATQELKNETSYLYSGGVALDEDYSFKDSSGKQQYLPAGRAGIVGMILPQASNGEFKQPEVVVVYQGNQIRLSLRYLYYLGRLYDFGSGYQGTLYTLPRLIPDGQNARVSDRGAALFLSERNSRAEWVKLFLLGQGDNFQLVHKEDNVVVASLKSQKMIPENQDFVFYNEVMGPIKIWKISYPADTEFKPEYLSTVYPESVMLAKQAF